MCLQQYVYARKRETNKCEHIVWSERYVNMNTCRRLNVESHWFLNTGEILLIHLKLIWYCYILYYIMHDGQNRGWQIENKSPLRDWFKRGIEYSLCDNNGIAQRRISSIITNILSIVVCYKVRLYRLQQRNPVDILLGFITLAKSKLTLQSITDGAWMFNFADDIRR